ncbi:MAG: TRAP transporter small permease [Burkholderiaceae bacterium]
MIARLLSPFSSLARWCAWFGGVLLIIAALTVTLEVVMRKLVSPVLGPEYNFTGSDEIAAYLFAVGTSLSFAHVALTRGNVRIDALYRLFGPRVRVWLDVFALIGLLVFAAVLLERAWSVAALSYTDRIVSNTTLRVPMAIPQLAWVVGLVIFFLSLVLSLAATLAALFRGDIGEAARISGAISAQEEVSEELMDLGINRNASRRPSGGEPV